MTHLSLFPLHTVLFPGTPLSLHIFEDRYKRMIGEALRSRQPFGVVLIQRGQEAHGPLADPHRMGCTAQITRVEPVGDGRFFVQAMGRERFRIQELDRSAPYLQGDIETVPLLHPTTSRSESVIQNLRPTVLSYLRLVTQASTVKLDADELPTEPLALAYVSASLLDIPLAEKQSLLETDDVGLLLSQLHQIYRRELAIYRLMAGRAMALGADSLQLN